MALKSQQQLDELNLSQIHGVANPLGSILHRQVGLVVGKYSFAVQGGAVSTINLLTDLTDTNSSITLPSGAIIKQVAINILTAIVSTSNDGTLALTANSSGDLLAAVDGDTLSGVTAGIPTGSAANMVKLTADRTLTMAIATHAFTAGIFDVYVEYYYKVTNPGRY